MKFVRFSKPLFSLASRVHINTCQRGWSSRSSVATSLEDFSSASPRRKGTGGPPFKQGAGERGVTP